MASGSVQARRYDGCFACGAANPQGLHLSFRVADDGAARAEWRAGRAWEGFEGILHGGIVTTLLDEAMAHAIVARGLHALTCELRVRMRKHVATGDIVKIRGWIAEQQKRRILAEASVSGPAGDERAHAWATFLIVQSGEEAGA